MTYFTQQSQNACPIVPLTAAQLPKWLKRQDAQTQTWVKSHAYAADTGSLCIIPAITGNIRMIIAGVSEKIDIWSLAHLPNLIPAGTYYIDAKWPPSLIADVALGFALAQYQFGRYKLLKRKLIKLQLPKSVDISAVEDQRAAIQLVRDLINTPANDMGPADLAKAAHAMAKRSGAQFNEIVGDNLLKKNYPAIHAVGRAGPQAPRLIDITHGKASHPLVVLVGKGVTFDTGGLDIKPYASMKLMKKDMGGAALMLGLAQLIIAQKLPIRLRVLIPAVENSINDNAFRPQDIIQSRKGLSIEIGSTDAEGRLILADALALGDSEKPALMIDVATLTGAARTALGADLPALFSNNDDIARELVAVGKKVNDPLWQLPLWPGYAKHVVSTIADITNTPNYGFAGSITAALFLERFVSATTPWVHIDSYAWNAESTPGRPNGGEALGLRTLFTYLQNRFA